jgi:phosphohistidine swiveling domain-containing protein
VSTPINVAAIQNNLAKNSAILTNSEKIRAKKAILSLKKGSPIPAVISITRMFL